MSKQLELSKMEKDFLKKNVHYLDEKNYTYFWDELANWVDEEDYSDELIPYKIYLFIKEKLSINLLGELRCIPNYFGTGNYLETIEIPSYVKEIRPWAMERATALHTVKFNNSINYIPDGAFYECSNPLFTSIDLLDIPYIDNRAFLGCSNLCNIHWSLNQGTITLGDEVFFDIAQQVVFDVDCDTEKAREVLLSNPENIFYDGTKLTINCRKTGEKIEYTV